MIEKLSINPISKCEALIEDKINEMVYAIKEKSYIIQNLSLEVRRLKDTVNALTEKPTTPDALPTQDIPPVDTPAVCTQAWAVFDKVIMCLALELPEAVYDDVKTKYDRLRNEAKNWRRA